MTAAEQIIKLHNNLSASREAVLLKGGSVGDTPAFNNLADEINTIPVGSGDLPITLVTDTDTAYQKTILSGALSPAKLKSIGGMTYCRSLDGNLLPYPMSTSSDRGTITDKVLFTSGDSSIKKNYTLIDSSTSPIVLDAATGRYWMSYDLTTKPNSANEELICLETHVVLNGKTVTYDGSFYIDKKTVVNSLSVTFVLATQWSVDSDTEIEFTISPVLDNEDNPVQFKPREVEFADTKVTEVKSYGANFFDIKMVRTSKHVINNGDSLTVTATDTSPGVSAGTPYKLINYCPNLKVGETYTLSAKTTGSRKYIYLQKPADRSWEFGKSLKITEDILNSDVSWYSSGTSTTATISELMVNQGTTAIPYKPYHAYTYKIPEALQGTGRGIDGYSDTVDFERDKDIKRCEVLKCDGTENWTKNAIDTSNAYALTLDNYRGYNGICSHYRTVSNSRAEEGIFFGIGVNILTPLSQGIDTVDKWKSYLAEQYANGTPVIIVYALAEPIETDLTETFDNNIEIDAGGTVEFVNENGYAVPSNITYLRRIS